MITTHWYWSASEDFNGDSFRDTCESLPVIVLFSVLLVLFVIVIVTITLNKLSTTSAVHKTEYTSPIIPLPVWFSSTIGTGNSKWETL